MRLHVAGTRWDDPVRLVGIDEAGRFASLPLAGDLDWQVSAERTCTGRIRDGVHTPCPQAAEVGVHTQCAGCSDLENPDCVFEPRCLDDPTHCACRIGTVAHIVYCAWYATLPKVGMTQAARVATRLREQGADAYFVVQECPDRATARRTERQVAMLHRLPEARSARETLPQLRRGVPWQRIEERAGRLRRDLAARFDVSGPLHRLDHPLAQPLARPARRVPPAGRHRGTWAGVKGNHLVYEQAAQQGRLDVGGAGPLAALKRTDLLGRVIDAA